MDTSSVLVHSPSLIINAEQAAVFAGMWRILAQFDGSGIVTDGRIIRPYRIVLRKHAVRISFKILDGNRLIILRRLRRPSAYRRFNEEIDIVNPDAPVAAESIERSQQRHRW